MAAPADGIQDPHLSIIDIYTSEHIKLYNKAIVGLIESNRYDLTRSKWTDSYQELENDVSIFGLNAAVFIVTSRYGVHVPTEVNNTIMSYPYITQ